MAHYVIIALLILYRVKKFKKEEHRNPSAWVAFCILTIVGYIALANMAGEAYQRTTTDVNSKVTNVELVPVSKAQQPYSDSLAYVKLTTPVDDRDFYLVKEKGKDTKRILVSETVVTTRPENPSMYIRVTQANETWFTKLFLINPRLIKTYKYTLVVPKDSVDLATKPDPAPYPEYFK